MGNQRKGEKETGMENVTHSTVSIEQDPPLTSTGKAGGWKSVKYIIGTCSKIIYICMFLRDLLNGIFCVDYIYVFIFLRERVV